MKKIIYPVFVLMAAFFVNSHVSAQTQNLPPVRTADRFPVVHPVAASLQIKGGGQSNKTIPAGRPAGQQGVGGLKAAVMPMKQGAAGGAGAGGAGGAGGGKAVSGGRPGGQTGTAGTVGTAAMVAPIKSSTTEPGTGTGTSTGTGANKQ